MNRSPQEFFDRLADEYTRAIERCVPRYTEMLWAVLHYLPAAFRPRRILELGAGTGNLSVQALKKYPGAKLHLVDLSAKNLDVCRDRLEDTDQVTFEQSDFADLEAEEDSFDLVISSIAIHHLAPPGPADLYGRIRKWLAPKGIFAFSDQVAGQTEEIYEAHIQCWREAAFVQGVPQEEWRAWMDHQRDHDHHAPLNDHLAWLAEAGFPVIDCPWRYLLWTVFLAMT